MLWPIAGFLLNEEPLPPTLDSHTCSCWLSEEPSLETEGGEQGSFRVHTEGPQKTWNVVSQQKYNSVSFKNIWIYHHTNNSSCFPCRVHNFLIPHDMYDRMDIGEQVAPGLGLLVDICNPSRGKQRRMRRPTSATQIRKPELCETLPQNREKGGQRDGLAVKSTSYHPRIHVRKLNTFNTNFRGSDALSWSIQASKSLKNEILTIIWHGGLWLLF